MAEDDLVSGLQELFSPTLSYEIDRFGRAANEDDLVWRGGVQELLYFFPGRLVGVSRSCGQFMRGTMNVGVLLFIEGAETVDDLSGLLRRGGIVQPDQGTAVNVLLQDGEVGSDPIDIIRRPGHAGYSLTCLYLLFQSAGAGKKIKGRGA